MVDKALKIAYNAFDKQNSTSITQLQDLISSKNQTHQIAMPSPRELQRSSLLLQRVGLRASKLEFPIKGNENRIGTASTQKSRHLLIVQNDNSMHQTGGIQSSTTASKPQLLKGSPTSSIQNKRITLSPRRNICNSRISQMNQRYNQDIQESKNPAPYSSPAKPRDDSDQNRDYIDRPNCEQSVFQEDTTIIEGYGSANDDCRNEYASNKDQENALTHLQLIQDYTVAKKQKKKTKAKEDEGILCQAISVEPYLRRCMIRLGWAQVNLGNAFHIRFDITDKEGAQNKLRPMQWYNHFPNNRELTTKAGLCKNLWQQCFLEYELKVPRFFPRCYDLSDSKSCEQFVSEFQLNAVLSIIKQYSLHFIKSTPKIKEYLKEYLNKDNYEQNRIYKQNFKLKCSKLDQLLSGSGSLLGNDTLRFAMTYIKQNVIQRFEIDSNQYSRKFTENDINSMVEFSQQLWENGIQNQRFSLYEQVKTLALHKKLCNSNPQYAMIDGVANVWVVKPSFNSRGLGVYCTNKLRDIIQPGKKSGSKVVQKYIESPFLLNQKKFDIRQWVLVMSWEPLDIYIFSGAYLKICGNDFNLRNLSDQYSHLSNFSIQKGNKQFVNDDLVMSQEQFETYVRTAHPSRKDFSWESNLRPEIHQVVFSTLKGVQDAMDHRPNTFEIYGFDLILDEELRPWVIEVNLSPACNERTEWLTKMVDDMCMDLLSHLEQRILQQCDSEHDSEGNIRPKRVSTLPGPYNMYLNKESFYAECDLKYRWIRHEESVVELKNTKITEYQQQIQQNAKNQQQVLELVGTKVNQRNERNLDREIKRVKSTEFIQRVYRGYVDRKIYLRLLQEKSSLYIQRYLRIRLASNAVLKMKQENSSLLIQSQLRRLISLNAVQQMKRARIMKAKQFVAIKCQSHFRRLKALTLFQILRKHAKATIIQSYLRKRLSKSLVLTKLSYKSKIVFLQRFFKKRFRSKLSKIVSIQKHLRSLRAFKRVKKFRLINRGTTILRGTVNMCKMRSYFKNLRANAKAVLIQRYLRKRLAMKHIKNLLEIKSKAFLQSLFKRYFIHNLKLNALTYNSFMNSKAVTIQSQLRKRISSQVVKKMKRTNDQAQKAILIQKHLRAYVAKKEVDSRQYLRIAILRIQSFIRMVIAKCRVREIRENREKIENVEKRKLEKKFKRKNSAKKKPPNEIEFYIDSLLQKDLTSSKEYASKQNRNNRGSQVSSSTMTPISNKQKRSHQELPLINQNGVRASIGSIAQMGKLGSDQFSTLLNASFKGKPSQLADTGKQMEALESDYVPVTLQAFCQRYDNLVSQVTTDDKKINNEDQAVAERVQKSLKVRKHHSKVITQLASVEAHRKTTVIMSNYSEVQGGKSGYQKQISGKISASINKSKTTDESQGSQRQNNNSKVRHHKTKVQDLPKPKTFAENLMSMLAKQNIGHAFSENPVEALTILKDKGAPSNLNRVWENSAQNVQRRNSQVITKVETTPIHNGTSQNIAGSFSYSQSAVLDDRLSTNSKFTTFPKLAEFKSATNNIYLQNRPVIDPRQESEFQQAIIENKLKQKSNHNLLQNQSMSRSEIQISEISTRKSIEHARNYMHADKNGYPLQSVSPTMPSGMSALEDNMMLQRPNAKDQTNIMVIQAYKKQLGHDGQKNSSKLRNNNKKKHSLETFGKQKNNFNKIIDLQDGIMFPLNLPDRSRDIMIGREKSYNDERGLVFNETQQTEQTIIGPSGGSTTMPPIFLEQQTKLMIF